jgi:adenine phosphoribosyltransferase
MPHPPINCEPLKSLIRTIPNFPKPGILFYDITTLLKDRKGYATLVDALAAHYIGLSDVDLVLGIEARGFIFGPALAYRLNAGFVPVRKPGKLRSKYTWTPLSRAKMYSSSMTCWQPEARWKQR